MEMNSKMCANELRKAGLLLVKASSLGMDVSGYGMLDVNLNSGNVYLWLEDYDFCLYIGLGSDDVVACWSSPEDGREEFYTLEDCTSLHTLEDWAAFNHRQDAHLHA
jgi:hypothetical protein